MPQESTNVKLNKNLARTTDTFKDTRYDAVKKLEQIIKTAADTVSLIKGGHPVSWSDDPGYHTAETSRAIEGYNRSREAMFQAQYMTHDTTGEFEPVIPEYKALPW